MRPRPTSTRGGEGSSTPVPAAPTGVAAVAGDAKVTLTWDAVSGASSYNVYWATATGMGKGTGNRMANASSPYVHQGLANGTTYHYVVTAGNASGEGDASQEAAARPAVLPPPVPAAPTGVAAVAGDAKVTLTWDAVSGASSYNVYWATATGVGKGTGTRIADASSPYVHQGLANGTTYRYVVTAGNASGEGDASQEVSAKPQFPILSIVLGSVNQSDGITLDSGGDRGHGDRGGRKSHLRKLASAGTGRRCRRGTENSVPDFFLQFNVDDARFYAGSPTAHVQVEVDYLDQGTTLLDPV